MIYIEYIIKRLNDLDLLPLKYRFMFADLVMFYKIYNEQICNKLPGYYEDRSRLTQTAKPPEYISNNQITNLNQIRQRK